MSVNFNPALHIQIAADSIEQLREVDVYRLFEQCEAEFYPHLAAYIVTNRPDLEREVKAVCLELSSDV